jgi:hypothetical protein
MTDPDDNLTLQIALVGCCGAYCGTCPSLKDELCKGCKLGYDDGTRDLIAVRCAIKRCCIMDKKLNTCADCTDYPACSTIREFHAKKGYKYGKYRQSLEFIRLNGYPAFLACTCSWKRAYGNLERR